MPVDLSLLPLDFDSAENGSPSTHIFSHTVLSVPPCSRERYEQLGFISEPVVRPISSLEGDLRTEGDGEGVGQTVDNYGQPLRFVRAAQLAATMGRWPVPRDKETAGRQAAIVAYLRALPQRTRVVLFWR